MNVARPPWRTDPPSGDDPNGLRASIVRGAGLAIGVVLVAAVVLVGAKAANVLALMLVAVILASGLEPVIAWLRGHLRIGRGRAILMVYGLFLATIVGLVLVVLPAAVGQLERALASLPKFLEGAREWAVTLRPDVLARAATSLIDAARRALPTGNGPAPGELLQFGVTVAEAVTSVLTLLTVVYFWLTEHARLQRYVLAFVSKERRGRARDVWNAAETRLGMWVRGVLILMGTIGIATAIAYTVLGVPAALLLGLWAALAEAIPIVGPALGAVPAVIVAASVSPQLAIIVLGVYIVLQLIEGNVLVPIVMRNTTGISPFLVILSVLIGAAAGGFLGALLAVPIAAAGEVLIEGLQAREVPIAQDPSAETIEDADHDPTNAPSEPDDARASSRA
jgi:predicted PurR-regulated permease PerM